MRLINKHGAKRTGDAQIKKNQQTEANMKKAERIETATKIVREEIDPKELEITGSGTPKNPLQIETYGNNVGGCGWNAVVDSHKGKIIDADGYGRYQEIDDNVNWVKKVAEKLIKANILNFSLHVVIE